MLEQLLAWSPWIWIGQRLSTWGKSHSNQSLLRLMGLAYITHNPYTIPCSGSDHRVLHNHSVFWKMTTSKSQKSLLRAIILYIYSMYSTVEYIRTSSNLYFRTMILYNLLSLQSWLTSHLAVSAGQHIYQCSGCSLVLEYGPTSHVFHDTSWLSFHSFIILLECTHLTTANYLKIEHTKGVLEGWRAAITVGTNDGPLTGLSNR